MTRLELACLLLGFAVLVLAVAYVKLSRVVRRLMADVMRLESTTRWK